MTKLSWRCGLVVSVLSLAGCGSGAASASVAPPSTPPPAVAASSAAPKAAASAAASAAGSPAAVAAGSAAASGKPIKIGVIQDLTGFAANNGKDWQDGWNMYWANNPATVAGHEVQVITADVAGQPDVAVTKAKQLVESDKVDLITGFGFSIECFAVAPYIRQAQMPTLVTGNCAAIHLLTDPRYASPYLMRLGNNPGTGTTLAGWAYDHGARNAIIFSADNSGYQESVDANMTAFVSKGGAIVQELHPPVGTTDYGPYFSQFDPKADSVFLFIPGLDGLRFGQTYQNYLQPGKYQIYDLAGGPTNEPDQLKTKIAGMQTVVRYEQGLNNPLNQAFVKAWSAKYPGRIPVYGVASGYVGAQYIVAALTKIKGDTQDKQQFLNALSGTTLDQTIMGPVRLDATHDLVSDAYVEKAVADGDNVKLEVEQTIQNVGDGTGLTPDQLNKLPFGTLKGKWVGMTAAKLAELMH
jgi:branched-chain amino acid transport system substrate-binding protein